MFNQNYYCPEKYWKGSFFFDIQEEVFDELNPVFAFVNEQTKTREDNLKRIDFIENILSRIFEKITGKILREIKKNWTPFKKYSLGNFIIYSDMRLKGLNSQIAGIPYFFDFYDNRCEFDFPIGLKEKMMNYARRLTMDEIQKVFKNFKFESGVVA